jgi:hypothetical protein
MSREVYAFILENALDEIKNACPDVAHAFVFEDGKIVAKDENTDEETIRSTMGAFDAIAERANAVGGVESITFHGAKARVTIDCLDDFFLATVTSKEADEKYINTLIRVWVPIVLRLAEKIRPASIDDDIFSNLKPELASDNDVNKTAADAEVDEKELPREEINATEPESQPIEEASDSEIDSESLLPEPPVNQLMVENLRGLLVPSDTVRIDSAVIVQWQDLYADKTIEEVEVETLDGKAIRCRFKPIRDSRHDGKGTVQMPEKIQLALQTAKGELVMVKPVVE